VLEDAPVTASDIGARLSSAIDAAWRHLTPVVLRNLMAATILSAFAYFQLTFPITVGDTDMWYHMADGRYITENGAIPDSFYYSFVDWRDRPGVHAWLFQLAIYLTHESAGYWGLFALRSALVILGVALAIGFCQFGPGGKASRASALGLGLLALTVCLMLFPRTYQLRPHLVSVVGIGLVLLIYERRRFYWALPAIAVLWVNLHGIEWVIAGLIATAYVVEELLRWRRHPDGRREWQMLAATGAAALALMLYPKGVNVFLIPFGDSNDFQQFVSEMQGVPVSTLVSPSLPKLSVTIGSAPTIVGFLSAIVWVAQVVGHRLRLSHALMSLGGLYLISSGNRFIAEWALLSMPMLASFVLGVADRCRSCYPSASWLKLAMAAWIIAMPALAVPSNRGGVAKLPFNSHGLPVGTVRFLIDNQATGKLHAPPNKAGYFAWTLYPDVRIFSDMKHHGMATFHNLAAFRNPHALKRTLDEHQTDFIAIDIGSQAAIDQLAKHTRFKPVFFDDVFVLYADVDRHPELARFVLSALNPHTLGFAQESKSDAVAELERVAAQDSHGVRVREKLWQLAMDGKDYAAAGRVAEQLLAAHPRDPVGLFMKASVLEQTEECAQALVLFDEVYPSVTRESQRTIRRHQGNCHYLSKDFERALASLQEGVNPYLEAVDLESLYQYAYSAVVEGQTAKARRLLRMLEFLSGPDDSLVTRRASELRTTIEAEDFE
jgi:hypothetical protein